MEQTKADKLYLCLADDNGLSLQTRFEVDSWIKDVEEADGSLNQTVIGSLDPQSKIPYFFITFKNGSVTTYDLVSAADEESAKIKVTTKKRNANKRIEFKRIQNLTSLIKDYFS